MRLKKTSCTITPQGFGMWRKHLNMNNTCAIFEIKSIPHDLGQGEFQRLNTSTTLIHWQQLDIYEKIEWKCPKDKKQYRELAEKDRIYKFLLGNKELNKVGRMILGTKPLPKIREVLSNVRSEESRRKLMWGIPFRLLPLKIQN